MKDQLYLVYTPAYDPEANRIEWLWRVSRRIVTHNHQRRDFALLLADVQIHFQALTQTPADVLRHIGSPFAPDKDKDALFSHALRPHNQLGSIEDAVGAADAAFVYVAKEGE